MLESYKASNIHNGISAANRRRKAFPVSDKRPRTRSTRGQCGAFTA